MTVPLVTIGASLGGLAAVSTVLRGLPNGLEAALVVVQHRRPDADSPLAHLLAQQSALPVREPDVDECWVAGVVYLAPPGYHMLVEGDHFAFSVDAPVTFARPSIDVLFESAADQLGLPVLGVVLTGSNEDGAQGAAALAASGAVVIVQDPATAESPVAPLAALARIPGAQKVPLPEIAGRITAWVRG